MRRRHHTSAPVHDTPAETDPRTHAWRTWSAFIVVASLAAIALVMVPAAVDSFRLPKDILFRAEAVLLAAVFAVAAIWKRAPRFVVDWKDHAVWIPALILVWTAVGTLASTNRTRSAMALLTTACAVVVYAVTRIVVRGAGPAILLAVVAPAVLNACFTILQELRIWNPFTFPDSVPRHLRTTALIGNPNDVGCYLAAAVITALAAAIVTHGRLRVLFVVACAVITAGMVASQTLTALIATVIAVIVLSAILNARRALAGIGVLILVIVASAFLYGPFRTRIAHVRGWFAEGNYNAITTDRLSAFAAAWIMAKDHPLAGVGPGCFAWNYFDSKIRAEQRYPALRTSFHRGTNYGEVHNDHLQVLAETGVIGYTCLWLYLGSLAAVTIRRSPTTSPTVRFAQLSGRPLAVLFGLLTLAQFPLELTAIVSVYVFLTAVVITWSRRE